MLIGGSEPKTNGHPERSYRLELEENTQVTPIEYRRSCDPEVKIMRPKIWESSAKVPCLSRLNILLPKIESVLLHHVSHGFF
jgi:hypothetical protein